MKAKKDDLSELNRKACEALGWYDIHEYADHHHDSGRHPELVSLKNNQPVRMPLPAISTDPGVAIPTVTEFAAKLGGDVTLGIYLDGTVDCRLYRLTIDGIAEQSFMGEGATIAEAIARAIVAASEARK